MKTACIGLLLALQKRYLSFLVTRVMLVLGPTRREVNAKSYDGEKKKGLTELASPVRTLVVVR